MDGKRAYRLTITCHAWFPGHTCRDEDNFCAGESLFQAIGVRFVAGDNALSVDVANISGDTYPQNQR